MTAVADMRFGVLALQMGLVTRAQLLECAGFWLNEVDARRLGGREARSMREILQEFGCLDGEGIDTVEGVLEADPASPSGVDPAVRQELLDLHPPAEVMAWLFGLTARPTPAGAFRPVPRDERYEVRGEIGRGGLGCVLEGVDRHLGREVALKVVLQGMPPDVEERFVREARITARLDHPNVVPVYDFDKLPDASGTRQLVLCMKRIRGRDLGTLVAAIRRGEAEAQRWTRARLLALFQDICLGVAYAHSKGVLHRDLKPSNVMIGDYGETLIVDWGVAKEMGSAPEPVRSPASLPSVDGDVLLTLEGDLIGTPLFMSPEQAAGRLAELDGRSDVYSLGGILYTILTHRPPFKGGTRSEVIESVLAGRLEAPSCLLERARDDAGVEAQALLALLPEPVPPELEAICLKALAHRREDRYPTALALHDDIQLFLEGVKQRQRNHRLAEEASAKAKDAMARQKRLEEEAKAAAKAAKAIEKGVKPHEDKSALWAEQDRAKALERGAVDAFGEADAAVSSALTFESGHAEARRLKAELSWKRYLEAEASLDEKEMRINRAIVERYNDGPFGALLKGDGTLTVRTRAFACGCLVNGRTVKPEELRWMGYHPFSGRELDGMKGAEGLPELEPKVPVRLKVHGPDCEPLAVDHADVWLFRFEEIGRRMFPVTPAGELPRASEASRGVPSFVVDATFEATSPYRPQGPGLWLGRTPIERRTLPMGSYLLLVAHEGSVPQRVPVTIPRCGAWEQDVTLFRPEEIPPGFIPIPAGPFGYQGDRENPYVGLAETKFLDDVFVARHPVTCREYCEFLNDLWKTDPADAARRVTRQVEDAEFYWPGPPCVVPTAAWLASAPAELKAKAKRLKQSPVDWDEDWPVYGVSWEDGMAFSSWLRDRHSRLVTLAHEEAWEKAARGTDRRYFPFGEHEDPRWANTQRSHPEGSRPERVQDFPGDESPYGVRGLGGNSRDVCLNSPGPEYPGWRVFRGGTWTNMGLYSRATHRSGNSTRNLYWDNGVRLVAVCRLARTQ